MKVCIVFPPLQSKGYAALTQNRFFKWLASDDVFIYPVIPSYAATMLENEGFEVLFLDCAAEKIKWENFILILKKEEPDLIAMEAKTPVIKMYWRIIDEIKNVLPNAKIALMGDHVSVLPEESLINSKADYILTGGDFDFLLKDLCLSIRDGKNLPKGIYYKQNDKIKNTGKLELRDLSTLPLINRKLTKWWLYRESWRLYDKFFYIMSGRGCPYKCTFCSWPQMLYGHKVRFRTPENAVNEIEFLVNEYGAQEIFDDTDTFNVNKKWVLDFCNKLIEKGLNKKMIWNTNARFDVMDKEILEAMKKSGCRVLKLGLESASQETLNKIRKGITMEQIKKGVKLCKEVGITIHLTAMVGYPWETKEDALKTISFVKELEPDSVQFSVVTPYPGTKLYEEALENNWFVVNPKDWDSFDMSDPVLKMKDIQGQEIEKLCETGWRSVYIRPKFIWKHISGVRSLSQLKLIYRGGKAVLKAHINGLRKQSL